MKKISYSLKETKLIYKIKSINYKLDLIMKKFSFKERYNKKKEKSQKLKEI